jgi:hypothetical protein
LKQVRRQYSATGHRWAAARVASVVPSAIESFIGRFREDCFERAQVSIAGGRDDEDRSLATELQCEWF